MLKESARSFRNNTVVDGATGATTKSNQQETILISNLGRNKYRKCL